MPNGNSLFNADRNTEETAFVHAFTNSKSKWLQKCERCTLRWRKKNCTQQHQNLQVMRLSTKKRKQQQKCKRRKHLEPQMKFQSNRQLTTDDITANKSRKQSLSHFGHQLLVRDITLKSLSWKKKVSKRKSKWNKTK